jgi:hypothetical protein
MHWVSSQLGGMWKIEWISDTGGNNLYRNVIFHENGAREFDIRRTAEYVLPVPRGKEKSMDQDARLFRLEDTLSRLAEAQVRTEEQLVHRGVQIERLTEQIQALVSW